MVGVRVRCRVRIGMVGVRVRCRVRVGMVGVRVKMDGVRSRRRVRGGRRSDGAQRN